MLLGGPNCTLVQQEIEQERVQGVRLVLHDQSHREAGTLHSSRREAWGAHQALTLLHRFASLARVARHLDSTWMPVKK
jgi:hypothetical protein